MIFWAIFAKFTTGVGLNYPYAITAITSIVPLQLSVLQTYYLYLYSNLDAHRAEINVIFSPKNRVIS